MGGRVSKKDLSLTGSSTGCKNHLTDCRRYGNCRCHPTLTSAKVTSGARISILSGNFKSGIREAKLCASVVGRRDKRMDRVWSY